MRRTLYIYTFPVVAGLLGLAAACSEGTDTAPGNGDGGTTGEEGTTTPSTEAGGNTSAAAVGEGGAGAAGGTTGAAPGATGGATGTTSTISKCWDFVDTTEGWTKNSATSYQLADKKKPDDAAAAALLANSKADWVATKGYGQVAGFVELTIPFAATQSDYQGLLYSYLPALPIENLAGKVIHAQVRLVSGMTGDNPSKPSGGKLVIKSGDDYFYADGGWVNLKKNEWTELTLEVNNPNLDQTRPKEQYDPTKIREISVEIDTSGSANAENEIVTPGVVDIDHVCY